MRSPRFLSLHPKMNEFMAPLITQLNVFALHLITNDGSSFSTLNEFEETAEIILTLATWD
jgi:starvation-inducible DNA-binding protein